MSVVSKLENKLGRLLKDFPELPQSSKDVLVRLWPWIALIFGIIQILAALALWDIVRTVGTGVSQSIAISLTMTSGDKIIAYLGIGLLIVNAAIFLMANPELKKRTRRGWDLLFLGALMNFAYSIISIFINVRGVGSFAFSMLGFIVGLYLMFQVQEKYPSVKLPKAKRPHTKSKSN